MYRPPYLITAKILKQVAEIQELLGQLKPLNIKKPDIKLRKQNLIKTIHHSLAIEGNSLTLDQITAIIENKRVLGPKNHIIEAQNAIALYDLVSTFNYLSEKDLLKAHKILMKNLVEKPGLYRSKAVGIYKGNQVTKMAPSNKLVPQLMTDLFKFLKNDKETPLLLKACIFHYEFEFIHPFIDGNGRMGRLWQQLILMKHSPIFEFIPVETLIHQNQDMYYKSLEKIDQEGNSTAFIEFSLDVISESLKKFSNIFINNKPTAADRIQSAIDFFDDKKFSRKQYLNFHKNISTATASRDLAFAVENKLLKSSGEKALAVYKKN